jgi:hypothetical protein
MSKKGKIFTEDAHMLNVGVVSQVPKVVGVKPTGSQILIELLTAQEVFGTSMILGDQSEVGSPQAYIVDFAPALKGIDIGLQIGDRVLLQGSYVPIPKYDEHPRKRGLVEMHGIKAILLEEDE